MWNNSDSYHLLTCADAVGMSLNAIGRVSHSGHLQISVRVCMGNGYMYVCCVFFRLPTSAANYGSSVITITVLNTMK